MLVLSRKVGERIHVGDNITIEVRRVAGNRVTLALAAPDSVRILRGELHKAAEEFKPPAPTHDRRPGCDAAPKSVPAFQSRTTTELCRDYSI